MTIANGQQANANDFVSTSAGAGDEGKVPKLDENGLLDTSFIPVNSLNTVIMNRRGAINGSVTPKPICVISDVIVESEADVSGKDKFIGFVNSNESTTSFALPLNGVSSGYLPNGASTYSITCNAGTDRVLVVSFSCYQRSTPASVSWNGITLNPVHTEGDSGDWQTRTYLAVIGSSGSNQTINLVFSAITAGSSVAALSTAVFQNVDQTTPYTNSDSTVDGSAGPINHSQGYGLFACGGGGDVDSISTAGYTDFGTSSLARSGYLYGSVNQSFDGVSSANDRVMWIIALNSATATIDTNVRISGVLSGFTGLTVGEKYYVSNTEGVISTTPGTATILVGKAISETQLHIIQN